MSQQQGYQSPDDKSLDSQEAEWASLGKTPIQILHEYGTASGNAPVYEMEKAEGSGHQPSFFFSVRVADIRCTGQGPTKKAAKHQAASAALKLLNLDAKKLTSPGKSDTNGDAADANYNPSSVSLLQVLEVLKKQQKGRLQRKLWQSFKVCQAVRRSPGLLNRVSSSRT
uniref:Protein kinase, interferon-inducible double stranded RNA dependent activator n=1 Tax=Nothobranchius kuhntae TaxID=321403 RepID=A0A1A8J3Y0_NOTKU